MLGLIRVTPPFYIPVQKDFGCSYLENELLDVTSKLSVLIREFLMLTEEVYVIIPRTWARAIDFSSFNLKRVNFVGAPSVHSIQAILQVFEFVKDWKSTLFCDTAYTWENENGWEELIRSVGNRISDNGLFLETLNFMDQSNGSKLGLDENLKSVSFPPFQEPGFVSVSGKLLKWNGRAIINPMPFFESLFLPDQRIDFTKPVSTLVEFERQEAFKKGDLCSLFEEPVYVSNPLDLVISPILTPIPTLNPNRISTSKN